MKNKYFKNIHTLEELKKEYKKLAMKLHPDRPTGNEELFKEMSSEYDTLFKILSTQEKSSETSTEYKDIINAIMNLNVDIEIIGTWIWITGDTKPVKETLKENGFRWAKNKKAWYWHNGDYKKVSHKKMEMDDIRNLYGSQKIKSSNNKSYGALRPATA